MGYDLLRTPTKFSALLRDIFFGSENLFRLAGLLLVSFPFWHILTNPNLALVQGDFLNKLIPSKKIWLETVVREGIPPVWNEYIFAGTPYWADLKSAVLFPLNMILLLFTPETITYAVSWVTFAHVPIAFLGMYLCLRSFRFEKSIAVLFAITYCLSGVFISSISYRSLFAGLMLLPYIIWLASVWLTACDRKIAFRYGLGLAICLSLAVYSAAIEFSVIAAVVLLVLLLFRKDWRKLAELSILGLCALLLAMPQLLPGIELLLESARIQKTNLIPTHQGYAFHPYRLIEWILPFPFGRVSPHSDYWGFTSISGQLPIFFSIYVGVIVLPGFTASLFPLSKRRVLHIVGVAGLVLISFGHFFFIDLFQTLKSIVPILKLMRYSEKFIMIASISLVFLAASGWQKIFSDQLDRKQKFQWTMLTSLLFASITIFSFIFVRRSNEIFIDPRIMGQSLLLLGALFIYFLYLRGKSAIFLKQQHWFLFAIISIDLAVHSGQLIWAQPTSYFKQAAADKITADIDGRKDEINRGGAERISSLRTKQYPIQLTSEEIVANDSVALVTVVNLNRLSTATGVYYNFKDISGVGALNNASKMNLLRDIGYRDPSKLFNLLSARYLLGEPNFEKKRHEVAVNTNALPKFFLTESVLFVKSDTYYPDALLARDFDEQRVVLIEKDTIPKRVQTSTQLPLVSSVSVERLQNHSAFRTYGIASSSVDSPLWFILNESFDRHWQASVNNESLTITRANGWAMAIRLPSTCAAGCELKLEYQNKFICFGFWLFGVGILLITAIAVLVSRPRSLSPVIRTKTVRF